MAAVANVHINPCIVFLDVHLKKISEMYFVLAATGAFCVVNHTPASQEQAWQNTEIHLENTRNTENFAANRKSLTTKYSKWPLPAPKLEQA